MDVEKEHLHSSQEYKLVVKQQTKTNKQIERQQPYSPDIPPLGIYPNDAVSCYRDTCTFTHISALFSISSKCRKSRYPSNDEWIMKCSIMNKRILFISKGSGIMKFVVKLIKQGGWIVQCRKRKELKYYGWKQLSKAR